MIMFARVKESRNGEYLQIVENFRDDGRVRQRLVLYVGHYESIDGALQRMPGELRYWRGSLTRGTMPDEVGRHLIETTDERLQALRALVEEHPSLVDRDRARAERHRRRFAEAARARREARQSL
jgi:hypothetical protein